MSIVKSFSVGNGDMFYIKHNTDNFTTIDCCNYSTGTTVDRNLFNEHLDEIKKESRGKNITRFISTHPDNDHIGGLEEFNNKIGIINFYCVKNNATKLDETDDFDKYCELRDGDKHFYLDKGCSRRWMNKSDKKRHSAGINCLWPVTSNEHFKSALKDAKKGNSPNNISPIITYSLENGVKMMWMGDMMADFIEKVKSEIDWEEVDILFAPHHGRERVPKDVLNVLKPKIIVIGEAESEHLVYYQNYKKITQNSAGDITFECVANKVHIYVSKENYEVDYLVNEYNSDTYGTYIGTLKL